MGASPYVIKLSDAERDVLEARTRAYTLPFHEVFRARIVLLAAEGYENVAIAERLETSPQVVHRWRKRFFAERLEGLSDRKRSGRRPGFPPLGESGGGGAGLRAADPGAARRAGAG